MTSWAWASSIQSGFTISSLLTNRAPTASARTMARVSLGTAASGFMSGLCPLMLETRTP